ncbi:helix-turn-helix domain-containing protein [Streptomyces sp. NPDC058762]|uniref:helix-turn-helix domain-containing protein n=1 Tax=Streptomyces sp. NPDC058762 TaxID=3346629 RepID=UPI0036CFB0AB
MALRPERHLLEEVGTGQDAHGVARVGARVLRPRRIGPGTYDLRAEGIAPWPRYLPPGLGEQRHHDHSGAQCSEAEHGEGRGRVGRPRRHRPQTCSPERAPARRTALLPPQLPDLLGTSPGRGAPERREYAGRAPGHGIAHLGTLGRVLLGPHRLLPADLRGTHGGDGPAPLRTGVRAHRRPLLGRRHRPGSRTHARLPLPRVVPRRNGTGRHGRRALTAGAGSAPARPGRQVRLAGAQPSSETGVLSCPPQRAVATGRVGVSRLYERLDQTSRALRYGQVAAQARRRAVPARGRPHHAARDCPGGLEPSGSAAGAGRALYCHQNTVRYRMHRLEEFLPPCSAPRLSGVRPEGADRRQGGAKPYVAGVNSARTVVVARSRSQAWARSLS